MIAVAALHFGCIESSYDISSAFEIDRKPCQSVVDKNDVFGSNGEDVLNSLLRQVLNFYR